MSSVAKKLVGQTAAYGISSIVGRLAPLRMSSSRGLRAKSRLQVGIGFGDGILKLVKVTLLQLGQSFARHDQVNQSLNTLFVMSVG